MTLTSKLQSSLIEPCCHPVAMGCYVWDLWWSVFLSAAFTPGLVTNIKLTNPALSASCQAKSQSSSVWWLSNTTCITQLQRLQLRIQLLSWLFVISAICQEVGNFFMEPGARWNFSAEAFHRTAKNCESDLHSHSMKTAKDSSLRILA